MRQDRPAREAYKGCLDMEDPGRVLATLPAEGSEGEKGFLERSSAAKRDEQGHGCAKFWQPYTKLRRL